MKVQNHRVIITGFANWMIVDGYRGGLWAILLMGLSHEEIHEAIRRLEGAATNNALDDLFPNSSRVGTMAGFQGSECGLIVYRGKLQVVKNI
jgi:hypothetical protein